MYMCTLTVVSTYMSISSSKTKKASMIVIRLGLAVGSPLCVGVVFHEATWSDIDPSPVYDIPIHRHAPFKATERTQFYRMRLWKHNFRGRALITALTMASCQAFLLLGFDQGKPPFFLDVNSS
jgi:hypothetical protein